MVMPVIIGQGASSIANPVIYIQI